MSVHVAHNHTPPTTLDSRTILAMRVEEKNIEVLLWFKFVLVCSYFLKLSDIFVSTVFQITSVIICVFNPVQFSAAVCSTCTNSATLAMLEFAHKWKTSVLVVTLPIELGTYHLKLSNTSLCFMMRFNLSRINACGLSGQLMANALTIA